MNDTTSQAQPRLPAAALAIALAQGLLLWLISRAAQTGHWPANDTRVMLPLVLLALALPLTLQLLWPFARQRVLQVALAGGAVFVGVCGALFAGLHLAPSVPAFATGVDAGDRDAALVAGFVLPLVVAWLLALPLLKLRLTSGRWTGPYPQLFDITWRGALTLAEAALFTGVFWLLLGLGAALFTLLGIDEVGRSIGDPRFAFPATTLVATVAIHLIGASAGMVDGLLRQSLSLLKWLLPLAGLIVVAFATMLLPRLPVLFAEGRKVMEAGWLLWLVAVTVLLLNAAYQSGLQPPGYGRLVERALRLVPPLLVVVAATALCSLALRTGAYGLTPARYWGLVTAVAALAYAAGYSLAAWSPGPWFGKLGQVNVVIALALLAVLLASLTPFADPLRLAVDSQARRALSAADDGSREYILHFLGRLAGASGRERLGGLARLSDAEGGSPALRAAATAAQRPADPRVDSPGDWIARIELQPGSPPLEPGLQTALQTVRGKDATLSRVGRMLLVRTDLDADGVADALLLDDEGMNQFWLFTTVADGPWTLRSSGSLLRVRGQDDRRAAIRRGDFGTLPPKWQDLRFGDDRVVLMPSEDP